MENSSSRLKLSLDVCSGLALKVLAILCPQFRLRLLTCISYYIYDYDHHHHDDGCCCYYYHHHHHHHHHDYYYYYYYYYYYCSCCYYYYYYYYHHYYLDLRQLQFDMCTKIMGLSLVACSRILLCGLVRIAGFSSRDKKRGKPDGQLAIHVDVKLHAQTIACSLRERPHQGRRTSMRRMRKAASCRPRST